MTARTLQPVRRSSVNVGTVEHRIWHPFDPDRKGPIMKAAEQFDRQRKMPGMKNGALGHIGLDVLRELLNLIDYKSGRLEPALDYLQRKLRRTRSAIVRALARLRMHGFLDWVRRTESTGNEGAGPQVRQVSNAYWFKLPHCCAAFVKRLLGKAPPEAKAREEVIAEARIERLRASPSCSLPAETLAILRRRADEKAAGIVRSSASLLKGLNPAIKVQE
jgi:hypothetical protein